METIDYKSIQWFWENQYNMAKQKKLWLICINIFINPCFTVGLLESIDSIKYCDILFCPIVLILNNSIDL